MKSLLHLVRHTAHDIEWMKQTIAKMDAETGASDDAKRKTDFASYAQMAMMSQGGEAFM